MFSTSNNPSNAKDEKKIANDDELDEPSTSDDKAGDFNDDSDDNPPPPPPLPPAAAASSSYSCCHLISTIIFVMASSVYLALAVTIMGYYRFYRAVPTDVLYADDDGSWWNYYNETNQFDDVVLTATDDATWSLWYNESFYQQDDRVFQVNASNENTWVTQFMILYFVAAMGFLISGMIDTWLAKSLKEEILYSIFVIAAGFGVASSLLVFSNAKMSSVLNAVSVHIFAIDAIALVIRAIRNRANGISWLLMVGQMSFVIGTIMDVVLSYYYIFDLATLPHARAGIAAACFWLLCSLIYLYVHLQERRGGYDDDDISCDDHKNDEMEDVQVEEA